MAYRVKAPLVLELIEPDAGTRRVIFDKFQDCDLIVENDPGLSRFRGFRVIGFSFDGLNATVTLVPYGG